MLLLDNYNNVLTTNNNEMTVRWLQHILGSTHKRLSVSDYQIDESVNSSGHGAVSRIVGINVIGCDGNRGGANMIKVVVKVPSEHPIIKKLAEIYQYDFREICVYRRLLKDLQMFARKRKVGPMAFVPPKYLYGRTDARDPSKTVLMLENLQQEGYKMADYEYGLNFDHLQMAVKELAKFHGGFIAMRILKNISDYKEVYPFLFSTELKDEPDPYFAYGFDYVTKILQEEGVPEYIVKKLQVKNEVERILNKLVKPRGGPVNCISHADCTGRNFMFRYNSNGQPEEAKLLDYQICMYTQTPINDLCLLLFCSGQTDERRQYSNILKHQYWSSLHQVISAYGVTGWSYTYAEFEKDFRIAQLTSMLQSIAAAQVWFANSTAGKERLLSIVMDAEKAGVLDMLQDMKKSITAAQARKG